MSAQDRVAACGRSFEMISTPKGIAQPSQHVCQLPAGHDGPCGFKPDAARVHELRDQRDPQRLGGALLKLRERAPKAPLSKLYDRHKDKLERL